MKDALEFAGSLAAHAVWCVSSGETLIPMLGHLDASGQRVMMTNKHLDQTR